nr:hypothetical protein [Clostridia bacterium]
MIIVEMNEGQKIDYEIQNTATKKKITFDDDLTINLMKREQDYPVHIDVCYDEDEELVIGTAAGRAYVAQIDIPAREYIYHDPEQEGEEPEPPTPVPLDLDKVTLSLWSIE